MNPPTEKPIRRVLIAEDNEDHLFLTIRALRNDTNGVVIEVDAVADGEQVLDFVYQRGRFAGRPRPHLVVLDLKMPRLDGLAVLERLKSDPELRTMPVVVFTSSDRPEDVEAAYRLGGNSYMTKHALGGIAASAASLAEYWTEHSSLPDPPA